MWRALAGWCLALCGAAAQATTVLFVAASPVAPGKFGPIETAARAAGLQVRVQFIEKLPAELGPGLWDGADLVVFDAPREHIEQAMRQRLAAALPALAGRPAIWMGTAKPQPQGLPPALSQRLHGYYVNGGTANVRHFVQSLAAWAQQRDWAALPAPLVFPTAGLYHPDLPGLVKPDLAAYLAWKGVDTARPPPMVALVFHQQSIAAAQTGLIDHLVRRIEAGGAIALPLYQPVMDTESLKRLLTLDGRVLADVIVNLQILLDPEGRRKAFEDLGRPVIQAMAYRRGDAQAWRDDPQGVPTMDVPFYLAQAEQAGITDIQIAAATRKADDQLEPIVPQADAVAAKALNLVKLRRTPPADKRIAILFWNYPSGAKNLSASFMNLPRSLVATLGALQSAGYRTEQPDQTVLTRTLQRLLAPAYAAPEDRAVLESLLRDGLAARLPLADYRAWLDGLPAAQRSALITRWGEPERSSMLLRQGGQAFFVVPRLQLGNVVLLPQPSRGERGEDKERALYHSSSALPPHHYLAAYRWLQQQADALVHFGTHGTQEWLPGKERGLAVTDWPMLAVGDLPVAYPYIVDNIGEATQTKRRGRAVVVSHQTPPLVPAGLHDRITRIHDLLHDWLAQGEGGVRSQLRQQFLDAVRAENIHRDMGWDEARIEREFEPFVSAVHDHLHELALTAQPLGLHSFGQGSGDPGRLATVLMMLGKDFWHGVAGPGEEADEMLIGDHRKLTASKPYRLLQAWVVNGVPVPGLQPAVQERLQQQARRWYDQLGAEGELRGLLAVLAGEHLPTSYGGDPVKNPDALPTGRNLYGFDPSRVPTKAAWEAGRLAMDELIATHTKQTGQPPKKLTLTLWSVETMRHFGLLEAQALWALGVEPVWDAGGRVTDVKLIPRAALGRPRVDTVLSATGLYRDHFPNAMRQLAKAAKLAAEADEADNPVAANARRIEAALLAKGTPADAARRAGQTRIFSSESGQYGSGLDAAAVATDTWKNQAEADRKLAQLYLRRMQFAYGPDEAEWGQDAGRAAGVNLYAEHLRGTQGAVLARTSNLYGMLTTDDPFQYLGGIALAVRHLDGKAPALYISNLRAGGAGRVEGAAGFLAKELATRNFHPGYLQGLVAEGYAGTLQMLDGINNFAGWQGVAREIVRHDQWDSFMDVYVRDRHQLGLKRWFEAQNPHALAQMMERLLEAARQGQWQASPERVAELKQRYRELARRYDVKSDNATFEAFVGLGFGLQASLPQPAATAAPAETSAPSPEPAPAPPPPVEGLLLERQPPPRPLVPSPLALPALLVLLLAGSAGAWRVRRA